MEEAVQEQSGETIVPPLLDKAWKRVLFGLFVVAAPIFNFSFIELLKPEWQDGNFSSYIELFLLPEASLWLFPLLAYAVLSYILLLWDTERYAKSFIVRLGIYTGMVIAFQYSFLTLFAFPIIHYIALIYVSPIILSKIYQWLTSKWRPSTINGIILWICIIGLSVSSIVSEGHVTPFVFIILFFGIGNPFWSFLIALQASRWLWKYHETKPTLPRGLGIFAWLSAYAFALRFNILKMYELYNALPTAPPDCYIATAAAKGHPRFVGSRMVTLASGKTMRVNRQLQRLKAVEIAWMGVSAPSHRWMRFFYDVIGRRLAAFIQNPILADVAFVLLIPVEWISFFVLKLVIPEIQSISGNLYHS